MKMMKHVLLFNRDTMFDDADPYPKELIFAPGEGKNLLAYLQTKTLNIWLFQQFSVVRDIKEILLFITVKSVNMNSDLLIEGLQKNVPNMFFKLKKVQMKSIKVQMNLLKIK